jgi:hypothetical protein
LIHLAIFEDFVLRFFGRARTVSGYPGDWRAIAWQPVLRFNEIMASCLEDGHLISIFQRPME